MEDKNINQEKFKPLIKGKADFYSWQLYKWMKKKPYFCRIYKGVWNSATGYDNLKPVLYIGSIDDGCFVGNLLKRICGYGSKLSSYAYCSKEHHVDEWEDVTEQFFDDYRKKGVCAIHGDMCHKWTYNVGGSFRKCEYCGKEENMTIVFQHKKVWR